MGGEKEESAHGDSGGPDRNINTDTAYWYPSQGLGRHRKAMGSRRGASD